MSESCLYEGRIRHRRHAARRVEFSHRILFAYLDLDELPTLLDGRFVARRPGLLRLRRRDYLGAASVPLDEAVRELVAERLGERPEGPIRLLTQMRSFGHWFNPVSFYYCFAPGGRRLQAVVAEVTNTPWRERHPYVFPAGDTVDASFDKTLHVSPFMSMAQRYRARLCTPGPGLSAHIESYAEAGLAFDATLTLRRRELTRASAWAAAWRFPFGGLRTLALIYGHAAGLWLRRLPVHPHPERRPT